MDIFPARPMIRTPLHILFLLFFIGIFSDAAIGNREYHFNSITVNDGLVYNDINCIYRDRTGFVWIGTRNGLSRYDGKVFHNFYHNPSDSLSLPNNLVYEIHEDSNGFLWIKTHNGFSIYNPDREHFQPANTYLKKHNNDTSDIQQIFTDNTGKLYMITSENTLVRYDASNKNTLPILTSLFDSNISKKQINSVDFNSTNDIWIGFNDGSIILADADNELILDSISIKFKNESETSHLLRTYVDRNDHLWIYRDSQNRGIYLYDTNNKLLTHYNSQKEKVPLSSNMIEDIQQDKNGNYWIATDHGGINLISEDKNSITYIENNSNKEHSISQNSIKEIYIDNENIVWLGMHKKGVNYYNPNAVSFPLYTSQSHPDLTFEDILCFEEDANGNIWLGTNGGGLIKFNPENKTFETFRHSSTNPTSLPSDVVVSLFMDSTGKLWVGTYFGGLCYYLGSGRFESFNNLPAGEMELSDDRIWDINEDSNGNLLLGTLTSGTYIYSPSRRLLTKWEDHENRFTISNHTSSIITDKNHNIWIGTSDGINHFNPTQERSYHFKYQKGGESTLSNNMVNELYCDKKGRVWAATNYGLNLYQPAERRFISFKKENGLPDNLIQSVEEDENGFIWISTNKGLSRIETVERHYNDSVALELNCISYSVKDGLQDQVFNPKSSLKTSDNKLLFGGAKGFNMFNPENIRINQYGHPKLVFTNLTIADEYIQPGKKYKGKVILEKSITSTQSINIDYADKFFAIGFAALDFSNAAKIDYAYKLEGFHPKWILLNKDEPNRVTFTHLNPGKYTLKIRATNNDGFWSQEVKELNIRVLPPAWRSGYAFIIYFIVICSVVFFVIYLSRQKNANKLRLAKEKLENKRLHDLDNQKINLFTNMSNEFRTPLSLIISPTESLLKETDNESVRSKLDVINRNARRLMTMINQMIDFRKIDTEKTKLNPLSADLIDFVKETINNFSDLSERKNIQLTFVTTLDDCYFTFDPEKMEKILFNLLSHVFRNTPEKGSIKIQVTNLNPEGLESENENKIHIIIKGGTYNSYQQDMIGVFDDNESDGGEQSINIVQGVGLSIAQEFIRMHNGSLNILPNREKGTSYVITFPARMQQKSETNNADKPKKKDFQVLQPDKWMDEILATHSNANKQTLLIVEENKDLIFMIRDTLGKYFHILEATNANEAMVCVKNNDIHLIISEILLPGNTNGLDLCEKIKQNPATVTIPVILSSVQNPDELRISSYEAGADAFLSKPFGMDLLQSRINNLLKHSKTIQHNSENTADTIKFAYQASWDNNDKKFFNKTIQTIEKHLSDPEFGVEKLSEELHMSRVHLYKKLRHISQKTPSDLIRALRMRKAAILLKKNNTTISEVCYQVGYNNPKYFSQHFKNEYKTTPSDFKKHFSIQ